MKFCQLRVVTGAAGRWSTGTTRLWVAWICESVHSGAAGGGCCRYDARFAICASVRSPLCPKLGMPAGVP